ncbi:16S rRNA (cytosine(1402)-N(4))-methyltransferase, partial [Candidatus Roizmanbacteria bacterium]|nr:16S rRNA (cytosine(1402)-N(4))-methyltransferase [Candidatus Roizmanbacteria bacterium]
MKETIEQLDIKSNGKYIDATAGEGGHLSEILKLGGEVLGIDIDQNQVRKLKEKMSGQDRLQLTQGSYANIAEIAAKCGFNEVDGVIFDLGLSMEQLARSGRGFSYRGLEEPLDMRLDCTVQTTTASDIVSTFTEEELYEIFASYAEELHS